MRFLGFGSAYNQINVFGVLSDITNTEFESLMKKDILCRV